MTSEKYGCAYLNDIVRQKSEAAFAKKDGITEPDIEFTAAKEIDYKVYEVRDNWVTYILWVILAFLVYFNFPKISYLDLVITIAASWVIQDIYGGVVHIVLDHKDVINYNIFKHLDLWRPALEFQWHHLIPHDIVDKPLMCVLGDMNRALPLNFASMLVSGYYYGFDDPVFHFCFGLKLLMAYTGQISHRLTHCTTSERPWYAQPFQFLLLDKMEHQKHHKDHSKNFAILCGFVNPFLNMMVNTIGLDMVWPYVVLLGALTFFDCHIIAHHIVPAVNSLLNF